VPRGVASLVQTLVERVTTAHTPRSLAAQVRGRGGLALLESTLPTPTGGRYSLVAVQPRVVFRSQGAGCEFIGPAGHQVHYGNPWEILDAWLARFDSAVDEGLPHPAGGVFGYWGYELRQFVEPKLRPHPVSVSEPAVPDCWLGFHDSLVVFDHARGETWVISSGWAPDGSRSLRRARERLEFWRRMLVTAPAAEAHPAGLVAPPPRRSMGPPVIRVLPAQWPAAGPRLESDISDYPDRVRAAQRYIRQGDIYQVNLAQRWRVQGAVDGWEVYRRLAQESPAPFAAFLEATPFSVVSASPELFLRFDGSEVATRPIKGTRPRGPGGREDAALAAELLRSPKERAELIMITDLLRNDLGRVCEFGSVRVPELTRLERYAQVQHLVSTVTGRLRPEVTPVRALAACFPGGSVTGAPKFRAMQIIDELEPVGRGPYTGSLGYLGFNRRSQLSIVIRAAVCGPDSAWFHGGAGIVADSDPEAEQAEVLAKVGALREILDTAWPARAHLAPAAPAWAGGRP